MSGEFDKHGVDCKTHKREHNDKRLRTPSTAYFLAGFAFVIYFRTLYPAVPPGDSGELITIAYKLGTAHPPGYPTFTMLGHLFTYIPYGGIAWRINLASAVYTSLASLFVFKGTYIWVGSESTGLLAQGLFCFCPLVWNNAVQAEVFSLHMLFVAAMLYLTLKYHYTQSLNVAFLGAFVCGLAMTNQHTSILFEGPFVLSVMIYGWRDIFKPSNFLVLSLLYFAGFLPYLYLVLTDPGNSATSWGSFRTLGEFIRHFTREEYGSLQLGTKNTETYGQRLSFIEAVYEYITWIPEQILYVGPFFTLLGLVHTLSSKRLLKSGVVMAFAFIIYTVVFLNLANLPIQSTIGVFRGIMARFYLQPNVLVIVWTAIGWRWFLEIMDFKDRSRSLLIFAGSIVLIQCSLHYHQQDQSENWYFHDKGVGILKALPSDALVHLSGDVITNVCRYAQEVLGMRPDVHVIAGPMMAMDWFVPMQAKNYPGVTFPGKKYGDPNDGDFNLGNLIDMNQKFAFFIGGGSRPNDLHTQTGDGSVGVTSPFLSFPEGQLERIYRDRLPPAKILLQRYYEAVPYIRNVKKLDWRKKYTKDTWEHVFLDDQLSQPHNLGWHCLTVAISPTKFGLGDSDVRELLTAAKLEYDKLHKLTRENNFRPVYDAHFMYHNKAILHNRLGEQDASHSAWYHYARVAPRDSELLLDLARHWNRGKSAGTIKPPSSFY